MNDSILFWNAVALEANRVSFSDPAKAEQQGPTLSSRALAIAHLAMYDAYAGIENIAPNSGNFPRYLPAAPPPGLPAAPIPTAAANDKSVAIAGAAYRSLLKLYATQQDLFDANALFFEPNLLNPANWTASFAFGVEVADALWEYRENDPGVGASGYNPSTNLYRHRADPDNPAQGYHAPFYGQRSKPFAATKRHTLDAPPLGNKAYLESLRQVRAKGIKPSLTGTLPDKLFKNRRTAEETLIGIYWGYDGANLLGTPPRFFNQIVRILAIKAINPDTGAVNNEGDNARLFAFVNAAMGDAGIFAWEQKYCHDIWRPVVGIREHDKSFGPGVNAETADADIKDQSLDKDADPQWLPLGAPSSNSDKKNFTPNFPAYPSGHATFGAAALHIARLFYGQGTEGGEYHDGGNLIPDTLFNETFLVSDEFNGFNRDNTGTVRPKHARRFDFDNNSPELSGGLGKMIIENGLSRVYLGVHWSFDAFDLDRNQPDVSKTVIGGVPLGLEIAKDIFGVNGKAPGLSTVAHSPIMPPADAANCAALRPDQQETTTLNNETPFLLRNSDR